MTTPASPLTHPHSSLSPPCHSAALPFAAKDGSVVWRQPQGLPSPTPSRLAAGEGAGNRGRALRKEKEFVVEPRPLLSRADEKAALRASPPATSPLAAPPGWQTAWPVPQAGFKHQPGIPAGLRCRRGPVRAQPPTMHWVVPPQPTAQGRACARGARSHTAGCSGLFKGVRGSRGSICPMS